MRFSAISSLLVGLFVSTVTLAAPAPVADATTVRTPHGEVPASKVHLVPEGGQVKLVGNEIHLIDASGNVIHVAQNDGSKPTTLSRKASSASSAVQPLETGWVAYADWYNEGSSPISSFATTWTVPGAPSSDDGQTIFLFNSIEPASGNAILQPVLQYGPSAAGGGSYWALASWYLVGSDTYYSSLVTTSTGSVLKGLITLTSGSGSSYNYESTFTGVSGTSLAATGSAELVWATETLEAYGVNTISNYPSGSTKFSGINLSLSSGTPSVSWSTTSDSADGISTTVNTDGATNAAVTISY